MKPLRLKAVLFDFDGTLTQPGALNFVEMRKLIGCPQEMAVLEYIDAIENENEKKRVVSLLEEFEMKGAETSLPSSGVDGLIQYIRAEGLGLGILTRNGLNPVLRALENFPGVSKHDFDVIITRNDSVTPKPSPEGVYLAAERMGVHPSEMVMVGDYLFDIQAGNRAGSTTIYLKHPGVMHRLKPDADFTVSYLHEIPAIIDSGQAQKTDKANRIMFQEGKWT
jgi:HAD superfamily hydrolase (TIGR01509 family)